MRTTWIISTSSRDGASPTCCWHFLPLRKGTSWKSLTTSMTSRTAAKLILVFNKLPALNGCPFDPHWYSSPQHGLMPAQIWLLLPKPFPCCSTWQSHQRLDKTLVSSSNQLAASEQKPLLMMFTKLIKKTRKQTGQESCLYGTEIKKQLEIMKQQVASATRGRSVKWSEHTCSAN